MPTTEGSHVARAFGIGVVGSVPFLLLFPEVWAYAFVGVAGLLAAWLVSARGRGLTGLLLGVAGAFAVWGGYEVVRKFLSCQPVECSGLSSPSLTVVIVVAFGIIGLVTAGVGWLAGRMARFVAVRVRTSV